VTIIDLFKRNLLTSDAMNTFCWPRRGPLRWLQNIISIFWLYADFNLVYEFEDSFNFPWHQKYSFFRGVRDAFHVNTWHVFAYHLIEFMCILVDNPRPVFGLREGTCQMSASVARLCQELKVWRQLNLFNTPAVAAGTKWFCKFKTNLHWFFQLWLELASVKK
jgi:hypothetical protein